MRLVGCFDSVMFRCPNCGEKIEAQTKAGQCLMEHFSPFDVPTYIAEDIDGEHVKCLGWWDDDGNRTHGCDKSWRVRMDRVDRVNCALVAGGHCKECGTELEPDTGAGERDPRRWFKWWCPSCEEVR